MSKSNDLEKRIQKDEPLSTLLYEAEDRFSIVAGFTTKTTYMIFLNNGHILRPKFRNKIDLAWLLFILEDEKHREQKRNDIHVPLGIDFSKIPVDILDIIINRISRAKNIPYSIKNPFNFPYEYLGFYLPNTNDIAKVLSRWTDLMVSEWRIIHGKRLFIGFGYEEFSRKIDEGTYPDIYSEFEKKYQFDHIKEQGIELKSLRGLWLANDIIIRLRAIWDKLLSELILKSFFNVSSPPKKLSSVRRKLKECSNNSNNLSTMQVQCLDIVIELSQSINEIRKWRDHDVHMVSETIQGVFSRDQTSETLFSLWEKINEFHNITREAIFACLGLLILNSDQEVNTPYLNISGYCNDEFKKFDPENNLEIEQLEELAHLAEEGCLADEEKKAREILLNLWRLEVSSNKIEVNYDK
ncbi:MAG: hypothetical protein SVO01_09435 [Thermotogota bacterium]|nr:hypothetical protein [Chloroflexota bacterium]MDY6895620.1 hypothetical protein [Thermotogota bacterium]